MIFDINFDLLSYSFDFITHYGIKNRSEMGLH